MTTISVFITSFNQRRYLVDAIDSVLYQTLQPYEIIIVDDCSTDGSQEVIGTYASAHPDLIRAFYHKSNLGIPKNKRFALEQVKGEFVTYLDGDDRFLPEKLESELATLKKHPRAGVVYSNFYYTDSNGLRTGVWAEPGAHLPSGYIFREVFGRDFPKGSLFRNELVDYQRLKSIGFYDTRFALYEDWELRIRLAKTLTVVPCHQLLAEYRIHSDGASNQDTSQHLTVMKAIYQKHRPLLRDLRGTDRAFVRKRLSVMLADLSRRTARNAIGLGHRAMGLRYCLASLRYQPTNPDHSLVAQSMLPQKAFQRLQAISRWVRSILS